MDRRTFLKTSTAAAAGTTTAGAALAYGNESAGGASASETGFSTPAITRTRHELRAATPVLRHHADSVSILAREIELISDGRILLRCSEQQGQHVSMSPSGQFNAAFGIAADICNAPSLALFSGLPSDLALSPDNLLTWHAAGAGHMFLDDAADEHGMTAMIAGHSGPATGLWANRRLTDLRDFAAARIDAIGLGRGVADIIRAAHDDPARALDSANLFEYAASPMNAHGEISEPNRRVLYRDGLHNQGHALMLIIERGTWNKLSTGDQLLLHTVARSAVYRDLAASNAERRLVSPGVFSSLPTVIEPLPADVAIAIRFTARQVVHDILTRDTQSRRAFETYQAFYKAMMGVALPRPVATV